MTRFSGEKDIEWEATEANDPPSGVYRWCGDTPSGSRVYQHSEDPNEVCIRYGLSLTPMTPDVLNTVGKPVRSGGANFGLTFSPDTLYTFNVVSGQVTTVKEGGRKISDTSPSSFANAPQPSTAQAFNAPAYIVGGDGNKYYPRENWFQSGNVNYYSPNPPVSVIENFLRGNSNTYSKLESARITGQDVRTYSDQVRSPVQDSVMGVAINGGGMLSARQHLFGVFGVEEPARSWHWCHLIAHSLRDNKKGQVQNNLVAGTAGVNGAMLALENALKQVLGKADGPSFLDYEVEAHVFQNTHIAKYIRAIIGNFGKWTTTVYFEATIAERDLTSQTNEYVDAIMAKFHGS